ncbi:hypothetical protein [Gordonia sp. (in: high G+C Gram-positive bacteria)]|uniref:hypothetical protein n=1 Tax=Gordonia sp. (in: high G+C Gram-positive bacteria) TaxID=84139 RepID=UPI0039E44677
MATIEIESDNGDSALVSDRDGDYGDEGIELDVSPTGMFSTGYTMKTISGAFQIGGRQAGYDVPVRELTLPFNLYETDTQTIEETISRFRRMWGSAPFDLHNVRFKHTTELSGLRWLNVYASKEIGFSPQKDWNLQGFARAVVTATALNPMYESTMAQDSWSNPSAGEHVGSVTISNPTDQRLWLEWTLDPATSWRFPDFSFGNEKEIDDDWEINEFDDRMIVTPILTKKLSVMSDPMMDTYINEARADMSALFNGVEPLFWVPPYTPPLQVPVVCNGPADATITVTMRRFWSAEAGLEQP